MNSILKKVYFHIGMSKAGSSAIQQTLCEHHAQLLRSGICYPRTGREDRAHYLLKQDLLKRDAVDRLQMALEEASSFSTAVLSCEGFWFLNEARIELIRETLAGYDAKVILYLRNPTGYLRSSYRQGVKQKGASHSCEEYLQGVRSQERMNYPALVERWARHFPLRVRAYEGVKHAIERDFLIAIEAPLEQLDISRRVVNPTPSDGAVTLMLLANRYLPSYMSRRARNVIRQSHRQFEFFSPIDDEVLKKYGKNAVQEWDLDVLREYLSDDDLCMLTS